MTVSLDTLAQLSGGRVIGDASVEVSACGLDSSRLPEGALFAALPGTRAHGCLLYTSPSPRDQRGARMPSSA